MTPRESKSAPSHRPPQPADYAAFVGIDWGDQQHAVCILPATGDDAQAFNLPHDPEEVVAWVGVLRERFGGRPVAVALEQSRGGLIHMLMQYEHLVLFPLNPKQAAYYREALSVSGKKDDPTDAGSLARLLREHHPRLRPWRPDDAATRRLERLCEFRRKAVDSRTQTGQRLRSYLKLYFPQALDIVGQMHAPMMLEMLRRWPTLPQLQRAHPDTLRKFFRRHGWRRDEKIDAQIEAIRNMTPLTTEAAIVEPHVLFVDMLRKQLDQFNQAVARFDQQIEKHFRRHDDAEIFRALPGAGAALAPRLLTAMGSDRERFETAADVQCYSGIAPVTKQSGKSRQVLRRFACPTFVRQTYHEFADQARRWSPWSKAYYQYLRDQGKQHHAALRALAFKWIRIILPLWKNRTTYDEKRYQRQLRKKQVPYLKYLPKP